MRVCLFLLPLLCAGPLQAEAVPPDIGGWFGLEMFEDMSCANNPVRIEVQPGSDRLDLRWYRDVTYADGSQTDEGAFRITAVRGDTVAALRLRDGVAAEFRFASDYLSFDYVEGAAITAPVDPDLRVTFVRCEMQGS